jgi:hypothetical protein
VEVVFLAGQSACTRVQASGARARSLLSGCGRAAHLFFLKVFLIIIFQPTLL